LGRGVKIALADACRIQPRHRLLAGAVAALALGGLLLQPMAALADTAPTMAPPDNASPLAAASPQASASPSASPATAASAAPSPSASPSAPALRNTQAQGELIAALTASEAHALMLQRSINQAQLNLVTLGQQLLDGRRQLLGLDQRLSDVQTQRKDAVFRLQADEVALNGVVRRIYKRQQNFLVALLESGGFGGLLRVMGYSSVVVDGEQTAIRRVQADATALQHAQTLLERGRRQQAGTVDRLSRTNLALSQQLKVEQDLQGQLQETIDGALGALDAAQSDSPAVAAERARLVQLKADAVLAQIEQAVGAQATFLAVANLAPEDPALMQSGLLWPIPNASISQGFGPTAFVFEAAYAGYAHFHTGVDLAVPLGTPVFAAADGVVLQAQAMTDARGNLVGYGNYVLIQHADGLQTLYGHLLSSVVKPGDAVSRGQLIGLVGSTGNSTGPHTHFEVRIDSAPVDPLQLLPARSQGQPVSDAASAAH